MTIERVTSGIGGTPRSIRYFGLAHDLLLAVGRTSGVHHLPVRLLERPPVGSADSAHRDKASNTSSCSGCSGSGAAAVRAVQRPAPRSHSGICEASGWSSRRRFSKGPNTTSRRLTGSRPVAEVVQSGEPTFVERYKPDGAPEPLPSRSSNIRPPEDPTPLIAEQFSV